MKSFTAGPNENGVRLSRFVEGVTKDMPRSMMYKAFRNKRIKVNGKRAEPDTRLSAGDLIELYINDEFFPVGKPTAKTAKPRRQPPVTVVYEDENFAVLYKPAHLLCHSDRTGDANLVDAFASYLEAKGEYDPHAEKRFAPALCNRIDRNTGGIVIAAKTAEALRVMNQKIKDREIDKRYLAIVEGSPKPKEGSLKGYLFKDAQKNRVYVTDTPQPGSKTCQTNYKTLASAAGLSLVECELITGRTHQIRAQFAHAGHPLLGDGKYGKLDKRFDRSYQALYSYKLTFTFTTDAGALAYLNGKSFQVEKVDFAEQYFPDVKI